MAKKKVVAITHEDIQNLNAARRQSGISLEAAYAVIGKRVLEAAGVSYEPTISRSADKMTTYSTGAPDALWSDLKAVTVKPELI